MNKQSYRVVSGLARQYLNNDPDTLHTPWYVRIYLQPRFMIDQLEIREVMIRHTENWSGYLKRYPLRIR